MADIGTMHTRIADELLRTDLSAQIVTAVETAIEEYKHQRFFFNEGITTFTTSVGGIYYDIPSDILKADILTATYAGTEYPLEPRDFEWIRTANSNVSNVAGPPRAFALFAEKIWIYPTPGDEYTLIAYGIKDLGELSELTDENGWTNEGEALIRNRAKKEIAEAVLQEPDLAALCERAELRALKALRARTNARRASKTIRGNYL